LETEGVVQRIVYPQIPVRVEYQLTEKGRALKPVIDAIHTWAERWVPLPERPASFSAVEEKDQVANSNCINALQ
jgi:DNA-binding HxlR family transcriptional regulator